MEKKYSNNPENAIIVLDSMEIQTQTECENCIAGELMKFPLVAANVAMCCLMSVIRASNIRVLNFSLTIFY